MKYNFKIIKIKLILIKRLMSYHKFKNKLINNLNKKNRIYYNNNIFRNKMSFLKLNKSNFNFKIQI
jgi:hypothetical protein